MYLPHPTPLPWCGIPPAAVVDAGTKCHGQINALTGTPAVDSSKRAPTTRVVEVETVISMLESCAEGMLAETADSNKQKVTREQEVTLAVISRSNVKP